MAINVKDKLVTVESLGIAYSTEQGARQEADQALSTRIDNIVAPDGDPSLTEVSDARVSGLTTHNTLKARLDADQAAVGTEIAELKADLGAYSFNTPVSYKDFVKGYQLQTYHVGYRITIKADATNQRAITTTPIYFPRKTFFACPKWI